MFNFFKKSPIKQLEKHYASTLEKAMHAQRNGDIKLYSSLTSDAESIKKDIERLESLNNS